MSFAEVSVPSRGILFPNTGCVVIDLGGSVSVPSRGILFPNQYVWRVAYGVWLVSVPSRGILFPNDIPVAKKDRAKFSFRPLSGHLISKLDKEKAEDDAREYLFPSPLGASYFQIKQDEYYEKERILVSVPSRGILFPNSVERYLLTVAPTMFPSPLGASYFQIANEAFNKF